MLSSKKISYLLKCKSISNDEKMLGRQISITTIYQSFTLKKAPTIIMNIIRTVIMLLMTNHLLIPLAVVPFPLLSVATIF